MADATAAAHVVCLVVLRTDMPQIMKKLGQDNFIIMTMAPG